jgi:predicted membrane chloride channel (bestrophin family)
MTLLSQDQQWSSKRMKFHAMPVAQQSEHINIIPHPWSIVLLSARSTALIPPQVMAFEAVLNQLDLSIATCDRLRAHPIPLAYTRHASRFCE